jgi:outer membrane immunogenic protein
MTPSPCGRFGPVMPMSATNETTRAGWTTGVQIEQVIAGNWKLRGEYRYADYGDWTAVYGNPANVAVTSDIHLRINTLAVGLSYAFGEPTPPRGPILFKAAPSN